MQAVRLPLKLCTLQFLLCCTRHNSRKARRSDPRQGLCGSDLERPRHTRRGGVGWQACVEEANYWHRRLLRARRERPRCGRAAECSQQFSPSDGDCHTPLLREVRKGKGYHATSVLFLTARHLALPCATLEAPLFC